MYWSLYNCMFSLISLYVCKYMYENRYMYGYACIYLSFSFTLQNFPSKYGYERNLPNNIIIFYFFIFQILLFILYLIIVLFIIVINNIIIITSSK